MPEHLLSWLVVLACLPGCAFAAYFALRDVVTPRALLPLVVVSAPVLLCVAFVGALALSAALGTPQEATSDDAPPAQPRAGQTNPTEPEGTTAPEETTVEETTSPEATTLPSTEPGRTTADATVPATTGPVASPSAPSSASPSSSPLPAASPSPSAETQE